jgi:bifunctional DNA primase/polymerase-like protein
VSNIQDAARRYRARSEHTIRLRKKSKKPFTDDWPNNPPDEPDTFHDDENIGFGNGKEIAPGKFSADLDLDWPEARAAADALALPTNLIYGRASEPRGHRSYTTDTPIKSDSYQHVKGAGGEILKVMGVGSQSMAPPSVHPEGETVTFERDGERGHHLTPLFVERARLIATVAVLARTWPESQNRHQPVLDLAGFLLKLAKVDPLVVRDIVRIAATIAGDPDVHDRTNAAQSTIDRFKRDEAITATLEGFGDDTNKALRKWYQVKKARAADGLLHYFADTEVFHRQDMQGETYFMDQGRALSVLDKGEDWLRDRFFTDKGQSIPDSAVKETLATIHARARTGDAHPVFTRCAFLDGVVYLDPCWKDDQVIRMQSTGWDVVPCPPQVRFTRPSFLQPLPDPRGVTPNPNALRLLFNLNDEDYALLMGAITVSLFGFPRVAIVFIGERGTIKTSMNRQAQRILDPTSLDGTMPQDTRMIAATLRNTWSVHFANLSGLDLMISNAFCTLLDGRTVSLPTLYKTADVTVIPAQGPIFLDGIKEFIHEGDLNDRCLIFRPPVMDYAYLQDDLADAFFARDHAAQLAAILDQAVHALRTAPTQMLLDPPRRAKFASWLAAIDLTLLRIYETRLGAQRDAQTDTDDVASAIKSKITIAFEGLVSDLLTRLTPVYPEPMPKFWPATSNQLGVRLRLAAPGLRGVGWEVEQKHTKKGSQVRLKPPDPIAQDEDLPF